MDNNKIIELQLDREINNYLETVRYCPFNYPAVILVDPFSNNIVAPTMYWLSCPYLSYEVDRLESESNLISEFGDRLETDPQFKKLMDKVHHEYAEKRKKLLSSEQISKAKAISADLYKTLINSGVGGIREKEGIKCLHTHLADYLVDQNNPVGEIVFKKIDWPRKCKICKERIDEFESCCD